MIEFVQNLPNYCDISKLFDRLLSEYDVGEPTLKGGVCGFIDDFAKKELIVYIENIKFYSLDLSITNKCNANCIYCPTSRIRNKKRFITLKEVKKIIDDLSYPAFISRYGHLSIIEIGGLFEPLLHPELIEILREFKSKYPTPQVVFYTNGLLLNESIISKIIKEKLITRLVVSIDGLDNRDYFASKGIDYYTVERNIKKFISIRNKFASQCELIIQVLTYKKYYELVRNFFKRDPLNTPIIDESIKDNTEKIIRKWKPLLSNIDEIEDASKSFQFRGEYKKEGDYFPVDGKKLKCPWLNYVIRSINITSNGDWIICCNDFFKEGLLGNVFKKSIYEIANTEKKDFIKSLIINDLHSLPIRCKSKEYCQYLSFL